MLNFHGNALADPAEVHALAGRIEDGRVEPREERGLYKQKGNRVGGWEEPAGRLERWKAAMPRANECTRHNAC